MHKQEIFLHVSLFLNITHKKLISYTVERPGKLSPISFEEKVTKVYNEKLQKRKNEAQKRKQQIKHRHLREGR